MVRFQSTSIWLKIKRIHFNGYYQIDKSEEKALYFDEKSRTHQGIRIIVLSLFKSQIMHAEEFFLIPKRMFISKNPTKEEIFDNPKYQQKATQFSLLQRTNPNLEQNYKTLTLTLIKRLREQRVVVMYQVILMK